MSARERQALDALARLIVRWGLAAPAVLLLTTAAPLHRLGGVFIGLLHPLAMVALPRAHLASLRDAFEDPEAVELLLERIAALSPP